MEIDERWIYAAAAAAAGFLIGALLAAFSRRVLGAEQRRPAVRMIAGPTATFSFWVAAVTGVVIAIGLTSPSTLEPIPGDILAWLPRAVAAGLILLAGYAGGGALSAAVAAAAERAVGQRPAILERAIRWGVMTAAVVLSLGNLGVETTALQILIAGAVFTVSLSAALLTGLGGQKVAENVAGGRTLRHDLKVGDHLILDDLEGTISAFRPAYLLLRTDVDLVVVPFASLMNEPFRIHPIDGRGGAGAPG